MCIDTTLLVKIPTHTSYYSYNYNIIDIYNSSYNAVSGQSTRYNARYSLSYASSCISVVTSHKVA